MIGWRLVREDRGLRPLARAAFSLGTALAMAGIMGSIAFSLSGAEAWAGWRAMFQGALGSGYSISEIFVKAAPLTLTGLAVALCCRLHIWNIGAEGQFVAGAVAACWAGLFHAQGWLAQGLPAQWAPALCLAAGAAGGAAWAFTPAVLKARLGVSEILSTLLLNYVAVLFMEHLYYGPWRDPQGMGFPGTAELPETVWLSTLLETRAHSGLLLALGLTVAVWALASRTRWGFRARVLGLSPKAAAYAGFSAGRITVAALCLSGALAGLAGAGELLGVQHRMQDGLASGFGFAGIIVAFLARLNILGVPLAAMFLGAMLVGADELQTDLRLPGAIVLGLEAALLFGALLGDHLAANRFRLVRRPEGGARRDAGEDGHGV